MDYSICQALKCFPCHVQALIVYDICCQWSLNFQQHVLESTFLELYDSLEMIGVVGKWHLATYIPECFPKFTLNFIKGVGEVDGEVLEMLWSRLDQVAGLIQAMSIAHAQEVLDDYMNDSNWRKMICMGRPQHCIHHPIELTLFSQFTVWKVRVLHRYGNTRGVSKTGTAGTSTVVNFGTLQYTAYLYHGVTGMHGYNIQS